MEFFLILVKNIGAIHIRKWFRRQGFACSRVDTVSRLFSFIIQNLIPRSGFNPRANQVSGDAPGGVLGIFFCEFLLCDDLGL